MAIGSNLPPQAYTRETLTTAFNWLQTQPESVKRMAPNPDALVALYMRSQRYGAGETEAPVSSQNFISDLKQLAEGLKQFDQPEAASIPAPRTMTTPAGATARPGTTMSQPHAPPAVGHQPMASTTVPAAPAPRTSTSAATNSGNGSQHQHQPPQQWATALHPTSQAMVAQIKDMFNLSSDTEAVNMMIAVAHKSLKNLI